MSEIEDVEKIKCPYCEKLCDGWRGVSSHLRKKHDKAIKDGCEYDLNFKQTRYNYLRNKLYSNYDIDENGCWVSRYSKSKDGYVYFGRGGDGLETKAHRWSYILSFGPIEENKLICHNCDNPSCINPNHLYMGTHQDNANDMVNHGRSMKGFTHTEETKKNISKSQLGEKSWNYGKKLSEETIRKREKTRFLNLCKKRKIVVNDHEYYTISEVCKNLHISIKTFHKKLNTGDIRIEYANEN